MFIDLTVLVAKYDTALDHDSEVNMAPGHVGTHVDVMDKVFPLDFIKRNGLVFNIMDVHDREIGVFDIDPTLVESGMFVAFFSKFQESIKYGCKEYYSNHPQLSNELIDFMVNKQVSLIGVDFAGVRRGSEHTVKDQYCADRGVFVIENLCNLHSLIGNLPYRLCTLNTYPIKFSGLTGLPCRVVAEI